MIKIYINNKINMTEFKDICKNFKLETSIGLSFDQINEEQGKFSERYDKALLKYLKEKYEGRCNNNGFVLLDSLKITSRSNISFPSDSLQLLHKSDVEYEVVVCCPPIGCVLSCNIIGKNKIGLLGDIVNENSPLYIIIPKDLSPDKDMDLIETNSEVSIKIIGKKFSQNDKRIAVIATLV